MANNNNGLYVPNNFIWDINVLSTTTLDSPEFKELLIRLYQNINTMCIALNLKDSAYYVQEEFLNGQVFFPNPDSSPRTYNERQAYRMVVNFGPLPNNTTISIPHNIAIDQSFCFTRIYGVSSNQSSMQYLPLPYASTTSANAIELNVDIENVNIKTAIDYSAYTTTYIILEYVKE